MSSSMASPYKALKAKQKQAGSYWWVIVKIMLNTLTNDCGLAFYNLFYKKILCQTVLANKTVTDCNSENNSLTSIVFMDLA